MLAINCLQQSRENHVEIKGNGKMNQIEPKIQNLYVRDTERQLTDKFSKLYASYPQIMDKENA